VARHGVAGVLLVGGASRRFGSPKALARLGDETLAERSHRILGQAFGHVVAVGKAADALPLPFPVLDDGSELRAPIVGVAAALRLAGAELCVFLPTDVPWVTPELLLELAAAADGVDVAVPQTGPLPGAYRRTALALLERRIAAGDLALHRALDELETRIVQVPAGLLHNVNAPEDLGFISSGLFLATFGAALFTSFILLFYYIRIRVFGLTPVFREFHVIFRESLLLVVFVTSSLMLLHARVMTFFSFLLFFLLIILIDIFCIFTYDKQRRYKKTGEN
jgi:molybdopterin-guanine dinucleotide biosynthesis protein A